MVLSIGGCKLSIYLQAQRAEYVIDVPRIPYRCMWDCWAKILVACARKRTILSIRRTTWKKTWKGGYRPNQKPMCWKVLEKQVQARLRINTAVGQYLSCAENWRKEVGERLAWIAYSDDEGPQIPLARTGRIPYSRAKHHRLYDKNLLWSTYR